MSQQKSKSRDHPSPRFRHLSICTRHMGRLRVMTCHLLALHFALRTRKLSLKVVSNECGIAQAATLPGRAIAGVLSWMNEGMRRVAAPAMLSGTLAAHTGDRWRGPASGTPPRRHRACWPRPGARLHRAPPRHLANRRVRTCVRSWTRCSGNSARWPTGPSTSRSPHSWMAARSPSRCTGISVSARSRTTKRCEVECEADIPLQPLRRRNGPQRSRGQAVVPQDNRGWPRAVRATPYIRHLLPSPCSWFNHRSLFAPCEIPHLMPTEFEREISGSR